jgi:hypothetical protein
MTKYGFTHKRFLKPADIAALYGLMRRDGSADFVFYDGQVTSWQTWVSYVIDVQCWLVRCDHPEYGTTGCWWLNGFHGRTAMIHFCTFAPLDLEESIEMMKQSAQWLASLGHLDSIYGVTPKVYRNVFPLMEAVGFVKSGVIPGACHLVKHDRFVDGVISVLDLRHYGEDC